MNWDEKYQQGEAFWDKGAPAPAMKQHLARHAVLGERWCRAAAADMT